MSEILACEYRSLWLMWMGPLLWCIGSSMTGVVRSSILQHFAERENNRDVVLKENNQDKAGRFAGLLGGVVLLQFIGMGSADDEKLEAWPSLIACSVLAALNLFGNFRAVCALQCPPAYFCLKNSKSQHFAALRGGKVVDEAATEIPEIFKLGTAGGVGKILMTSEGQYVDRDGELKDHPVAADLVFTGRGWLMKSNWGSQVESAEDDQKTIWEVIPKRHSAKLAVSHCDLTSNFFPPGFPRTTLPKYEEHCAYSIMQTVTSMPIAFINMWIKWKFVYGVGDTSKSPEYAVYITCYMSTVAMVFGLIAGLPSFSRGYDADFYFISHAIGNFLGGFIGNAAALSTFPVFMVLIPISVCTSAWSDVVHAAINAQANMMWASHPEVDLVHVLTSLGNRGCFMSGLTGFFCIWFARHLQQAGPQAEPPIPTMMMLYSLMQAANLYSAYEIYKIYKQLMPTNATGTQYEQFRQEEGAEELKVLSSHVGRDSSSDSTRGMAASTGSGKKPSPTAIFWVLQAVLVEVIVYGALVSTLSDVETKLTPCSGRCMQFKLLSDLSFIPNTGVWPFPLHNGQTQHEIQDTCKRWGGNFCTALPGAQCKAITQDTCTSEPTLKNVQNHIKDGRSKLFFLGSLCVYSILVLVHDSGLRMGCLGAANAIILQVLTAYTLAFMTATALLWASGAMQLFFSKVGGGDCVGQISCVEHVCGCYFEFGDLPAMFALAVPASLAFKLRTRTICTMRAAIIGSSYLSTTTYYLPHNFVQGANVWSALGPSGLGDPRLQDTLPPAGNCPRMKLAKSMARWICVVCPVIIVPPLLFASCSLIYRGVGIILYGMKTFTSIDVGHDVASSMGMCGFFGMIFLQFVVLFLFIPETWRLFYILTIQLGKFDGDLAQVKSSLKLAHPEFAWALDEVVQEKIELAREAPLLQSL
ncbi:unnamed protein product [Polarella glacialis]|uniref:Protein root UVB sensitive/RUS domain-containing protein n=1 Tax=Polarella glacialis TaxID=89957 RepID=A0A813DMT8_POLGL|nr:unnamed protein product [Polarella glacialis]